VCVRFFPALSQRFDVAKTRIASIKWNKIEPIFTSMLRKMFLFYTTLLLTGSLLLLVSFLVDLIALTDCYM
jgi:hypothetical protein